MPIPPIPILRYTALMTDAPGSIPRRKLSDEVQDRLLARIRSRGMEPGTPLPSERELMAEYRVGRPAIREAMQNLQRMGLIEIKHGERPRVGVASVPMLMDRLSDSMRHLLTHSASTMDNLKEARALFEGMMARMAAERRTDADIARLEEALRGQADRASDPEAFLRHDGLFHRAIGAVAGNPLFESVSQALFDWLSIFHTEQVARRGLERLTLAEHRAILDAIVAGDPGAAQTAMTDHLTRANALYHQDNARS